MTNPLYDTLIAPHAGNSSTFLECDDGTQLSYDAFVRRAAQMAHVLVAAGVAPGDRVVVQAPKLSDTIALYAGSVQAGAVYLPLNTAYTEAEMEYFVADAQPKLIVCDTKDETAINAIATKIEAKVLTLDGAGGSLSATANEMPEVFETVQRDPDDLASLLYTSGTTGRSKGAMLSHKNLLSNAEVLTELWQITDDDRLVHALPIFHTHGLFVAMNTALLSGASVRFMEKFDLDAVLDTLPTATLMMGVPTFYTRLLSDERFGKPTVANMRLFISGSAPLLAETHVAFEDRTGHRILERYGMTETNMITSNPYNGERIAGTVGYALPGTEVKITDAATGDACATGDIGVIEVRGDNVFQGYWQMPEKTAEELRDDGFFITGDLGMMAKDGRVSIVGRQKDLIIAGGYNIYPKEIEDVINDVPGVLESAVYGVPHPDFGESVIASIVLEDPALSTDRIISMVETNLARFKHPREYQITEALPRNTMGKVQKNILRELHQE
ncbi:Long-chain-fatty-acid--CoA ligase [Aliiroseovarius pelagivivens]|uniref:Long-chain-fatty-acid--CoA ligase n=1 Tax=Aliiroseovarius pelagivivens TaxID=1639690 RepID=A0A2R8AI84_9RHOB|nr:malonyl-CoA synthase [Aliiroseovarius pelagivivens]SPF75756.1 Long-chain-fatty-acid--CoA ligase [Aliiroseovarius pelagivivens]